MTVIESNPPSKGMRSFLIIWLGELISMIGSGLSGFAMGVWIFQETKQATPFAITVLLANLPRILLAPWAGSLADRWNRRWIMILADAGSALTTLFAVVLLSFNELQIWHVYVIVVCSSIFGAFQEPAYTASITMLVPKKDLARASGLTQLGQAIEPLVTPLLAGFLFVLIGLRGIFLLDFISFFFAVGALLLVRIPQPKIEADSGAAPGSKPSVWGDMVFGWSYLWRLRGLFWMLWYFALVNFLLNFAMVLMGPLVLSFGDASTLGVVQMAAGFGMLLGSLVVSAWGGPKRRVPAIIGIIAASAVGLAVVGLRPSVYTTAGGILFMLFCIPAASAFSQAIFQSKVSPGAQGRVFAARGMISRSMMPLAFLIAGPLADHVFGPFMLSGGLLASGPLGALLGVGPGRGIGLMFLGSGLLLILVSALVFTNPRIRRLEDELPDALEEPSQPSQPEPETVVPAAQA
jgi:MFS family permease